MGFWQTGYGEFHEEVGLEGYEFGTSTPEYPCGACGEIFATADEPHGAPTGASPSSSTGDSSCEEQKRARARW